LIADGHFDERHLCHSPQERIFLHGRWQEGLEPESGVSKEHRDQIHRFEQRMREFAETGEFTIPVGDSPRTQALDRLSMRDWLRQQKFTSPYLDWYVDYACRDDYGSHTQDTSAWAGIHYFAAREHEERGPFTWPEGNGFLVKHLLRRIGKQVRTASMVVRLERDKRGFRVLTESVEYQAETVIWAAPTFLLPYVFADAPAATRELVYSPWLTANLTLVRLPAEQYAPLAWDNVIYDSPSLGYVVATHQSLRSRIDKSVWTYYHALATGSPADNRRLLLEKDWAHWKEAILKDLERGHPEIRQCVSRIDVMRLGHAMVRPVIGCMFSENRKRLADWGDALVLANSDLSGISIFEEAQYRGVRAADKILRRFGRA
jgi:hypothetical protein